METGDVVLRLSEVVSPVFGAAHRALFDGTCSELVLKGGRGSGKSSFASVVGVLLLIRHPEMHGVVVRKVARTLRSTAYAQYVWAVGALGMAGEFRCTVSPMEITYLPTGQKLMFFGADDDGKLKSLKAPFGYIGYLHLEELDQFAGEEEVRSIEQSVLRGGAKAYEIQSFNPPRSRDHWVNRCYEREKAGRMVHHSTYETMPPQWLGKRFLQDAAFLRKSNPAVYEHEYLGIANGVGGLVFDNVRAEPISNAQIAAFDRVLNGVDWGWYPDPWAFVRMHYAAGQRTLYLFDEAVCLKKSNAETAAILKEKGVGKSELVMCDCAEPKSIRDYRELGLRARGAKKGRGSLAYSFKWLQSLAHIVIDPARCPGACREFTGYSYERGAQGVVLSSLPDRDNHTIDAVRYACEALWRRN